MVLIPFVLWSTCLGMGGMAFIFGSISEGRLSPAVFGPFGMFALVYGFIMAAFHLEAPQARAWLESRTGAASGRSET